MSKRELSRRAGVWHSSVNRAMDPFPDNPPGPKVLKGIARALRVPEEFVFRLQGVLGRKPPHQIDHDLLINIYEELRAVGREAELMAFASYMMAQIRPEIDDEDDASHQ